MRAWIVINWIKAHNGHALNDRADFLARQGSEIQGPHLAIPVPDSHIKDLINRETIARWNRGWANVEGHRQTKLFFPEINVAKANKLYKCSKARYSQAVRWITGFNGLAYQNNKINPNEFPNPNCQLCEQLTEETSAHLIMDCPALLWERRNAFRTIHEVDKLDELKMPELLNFLKQNRVSMMENISEYPLLFVEDYQNINHDMIDAIANHETSILSRNDDNDDEDEEVDPDRSPPRKRRDMRTSMDRTGVDNRSGIG